MFFFVGCAATKVPPQQLLGIPDSEWQSFDKNKQQELLQIYKQINSANQAEDQQLTKQNNQLESNLEPNKVDDANVIEVKVYDGSALMPPFTSWQAFTPATFIIPTGRCQNAELVQLDGTAKTSLRSCYKDKLLHLDPSRYELSKQQGTISIPYSPLWDYGFVYHNINSGGYVKLKNVTVAVKLLNKS